MKVEESLNVTFDKSPPPIKLSPLVDDDVGEDEAIKFFTKVVNNNNDEDESIEVDEVVNIKESKNHPLDQFNFTSMILYRMEEVKNKCDGPMPFAMILTRLYNHILQTNPQAIIPLARFTFHKHVMNPLDISRNPTKEKGKRVASPSTSSSSSLSSDDNEAPSFHEFYKELPDNEDLTDA
ncbi:hypothetical protein Tco_1156977 [Tanacetum coccineum]